MLIAQLSSLPVLEEVKLGEDGWYPNQANEYDEHISILRDLCAELKSVHTFGGTLGLEDHETILIADVIKSMPALRHVDFAMDSAPHCWTHRPYSNPGLADMMAEAMQSLSGLTLETLKGVEHNSFFWEHFSPTEQVHLRSFETRLNTYNLTMEETLSRLMEVVDHVRRLPSVEELTLTIWDEEGRFCTSHYSDEHWRAPQNVELCRLLQPQLERLVAKATGSRHAFHGRGGGGAGGGNGGISGISGVLLDEARDAAGHEALLGWALGLLAPQIRRFELIDQT